jgi:hypothetical protein
MGKSLGPQDETVWVADSRFLVLVTFMNLFLCQRRHSGSDIMPQTFYLYTQNLYFAAIIVGLVLDGNGNFGCCGMMERKVYNRSRRTKIVQIC